MVLRNLDDLVVFLKAIDCGSFSAAARALDLAPATVSKQISRLERILGTTLFERNTRHLKITEEGRAVAERVRSALALLDEASEIAGQGNQELTGTLRVTASVPFGRKYVAPAISVFRQHYPKVGFELQLSDHVADLFTSDIDLAIRMGELSDSRLVARRVAGNRRILTASPDYLRRHGTPRHPSDLTQHTCLLFNYPGLLRSDWTLNCVAEHYDVSVSGDLRSDNGEVLREWCLAGLGISLRETWDVSEELRSGSLVRVLPLWEASPSQISIVRARREPVPRRLSTFIDFLIERWCNAPWEIKQ